VLQKAEAYHCQNTLLIQGSLHVLPKLHSEQLGRRNPAKNYIMHDNVELARGFFFLSCGGSDGRVAFQPDSRILNEPFRRLTELKELASSGENLRVRLNEGGVVVVEDKLGGDGTCSCATVAIRQIIRVPGM
jgi:hypothetical protein